MAFRERAVTGLVKDADGTPVLNARLKFILTKKYGLTGDTVVVDRPFITTTNGTTGAFSQTLWCDEDSLIPIDYTVQFPVVDAADADPGYSAVFSLAYEDGSPKDIGTLIAESLATTPSSEASFAALIASYFDAKGDLLVGLGDDSFSRLAPGTTGFVLTVDPTTPTGLKWAAGGAGGGMAIGGAIGSATAGSVLYVDGSSQLAQNNANFSWDNTALRLHIFGSDSYGQVHIGKVDPGYGAVWFGQDAPTSANYAFLGNTAQTRFNSSGELWFCITNITAAKITSTYCAAFGYSADPVDASTTLTVVPGNATYKGLVVKLQASQVGDAFQIQPSGSSTPLTAFDKSGGWLPASMADSGAANNTVYYSTTASKLAYKDSGGLVHQLEGGGGLTIGGAISGATLGSVLFAGTSGVLAQDNANFFWDDTNNRLGIGNAAPSWRLHLTDASNPQLRLAYDASRYSDFQLNPSGNIITTFWNGMSGVFDVEGIITSGIINGGGEIRSYQNGGAPWMSLKTDLTALKSGLFRSNTDFICYYDLNSGDTVLDATFTASVIRFAMMGTEVARFDKTTTAGQTRFLIYDVDNATLERVTVGAADSGGTGFKVLRIPN
jgi:hypothetical protein